MAAGLRRTTVLETKNMKTLFSPALPVTMAAAIAMAWALPASAQLSGFPDLDEDVALQLGQQLPLLPQAAAVVARAGWSEWHERQTDLRDRLGRTDAAADPDASIGGGVWGRIHYGSADHEVPLAGPVVNDYEQRTYGFNAGADLITAGRWVLGATLGYTRSVMEFEQLGTEADFDSVGAGVYASYVGERLYVDALYRHDWSTVDIDAPALGIQSENDQLSSDFGSDGLHVEAGMRLLQSELGGAVLRLEPVLNLSWVRVTADDVNVIPQDPLTDGREGNRIAFNDHDSRRAALGARASLTQALGGSHLEYSLLLRQWHEFEREAKASVHLYDEDREPLGEVPFEHKADSGFTELKLGLAFNGASGRTSALLNATGYTGSNYDGWNVTAGIRYLW